MTERIVRIIILIVGAVLLVYTMVTPGTQIVASIAWGACFGITIATIMLET